MSTKKTKKEKKIEGQPDERKRERKRKNERKTDLVVDLGSKDSRESRVSFEKEHRERGMASGGACLASSFVVLATGNRAGSGDNT